MTKRFQDDGQRGSSGVLLSVRRNDEGFEITVDRVRLARPASFENGRTRMWAHETFVHFMQMPPLEGNSTFELTDDQLARFGLTILGSIYAEARELLRSGESS